MKLKEFREWVKTISLTGIFAILLWAMINTLLF